MECDSNYGELSPRPEIFKQLFFIHMFIFLHEKTEAHREGASQRSQVSNGEIKANSWLLP